jgi:hypothetical protein
LVKGEVISGENGLKVDNHDIPSAQGTSAMLSSALAVTEYLGIDSPHALLAGDIGSGEGSKEIIKYLIENIKELSPKILVLHYWMPYLILMKKFYAVIEEMEKKPILIADAASMYTAKAVGLAEKFDIFTPDASELAFLADPDAIHPAYISKHLFDSDISKVPDLIEKAYKNNGAAKMLLVKGAADYVAVDGEIIETISEPDVPILECIGGTGDTITGMVSAFTYAELEPHQAAVISAKANRAAGKITNVNPGTKVDEIIGNFKKVFKENLCSWSGVCIR